MKLVKNRKNYDSYKKHYKETSTKTSSLYLFIMSER